jgi:hypothetical protein
LIHLPKVASQYRKNGIALGRRTQSGIVGQISGSLAREQPFNGLSEFPADPQQDLDA